MTVMLKAKDGCCEEAAPTAHAFYIPCNAPATTLVYSERDNRKYRMCDACAWHNVRNRGMTELEKLEPHC